MPGTGWQPTCRDLTSPPCLLPLSLGAATETDLISCRGWHSRQLSTDADKIYFFRSLPCFLKLAHFVLQLLPKAYRGLSDFWTLNVTGNLKVTDYIPK